jgi:hypothetical protein
MLRNRSFLSVGRPSASFGAISLNIANSCDITSA